MSLDKPLKYSSDADLPLLHCQFEIMLKSVLGIFSGNFLDYLKGVKCIGRSRRQLYNTPHASSNAVQILAQVRAPDNGY